ncbi:hypothetical protein A3D77_03660 [Candidatus Gottesmanbacteria bacterium RIFCSPHIGHO2_02_FULL_39_11]|uniref:FtsK domain-containing protein n=1 Tax=Candidatus Gottesmanbacteria bacterium RIFCSPHIGHO2_02_FULL_39_11 TaxID=1798382 RepID=A0A1F5ZWZ2_9BACT|nr:MAG: hypothetical protein A3D77_03660 [Candidatus Gottesmanbacteria bacterium RIFCSPHIGHO2_02_FULL_39_11]
MPRRRTRRRNSRTKIKSNTIFTLTALFLFGAAVLLFVSFLKEGSSLDILKQKFTDKIGWGTYLLPLIFTSFGFLLLRIKFFLSKAHISIGLLLSFICLIALTRGGSYGDKIWLNFSHFASDIGAIVILLLMLSVGLVVLFDISFEEIIEAASAIFRELGGIVKNMTARKEKSAFVQKLLLKSPNELKRELNQKEPFKAINNNIRRVEPIVNKPKHDGQNKDMVGLGTAVISNLPTQSEPWDYPPLSLLTSVPGQKADRGDMKNHAQTIEKTLESFGITARVAEVNLGPAVTQYALEIALGTKLSKITSLANDLALALAAPTGQIRIEAPIPGRNLVGIEVPNRSLEFVTLRTMLSSETMKKRSEKLLVAMGLDVSGNPVIANIAKMPHVLVAGTTGSGKSVLINAWIASLLFRSQPSEVRLILVDPKRVELTLFNGIPHLLTPVIVEPDKILSALRWAINEMHRRYKMFAEVGVRNIDGYNELSGFQALPYIVIFIDELADLMAFAPAEVEDAICKLAQMSRATGIHLVLATQRPSVDVITGLIKANIPSRIAFNVSAMMDSRVILDTPGAEKLLGRGDMLYVPPDQAKPTRIQGTYVSEIEISKLVEFLKNKNQPVQYTEEVTSINVPIRGGNGTFARMGENDDTDAFFEEAVRLVCQYSKASASFLQRKLKVGYARAARIMDELEAKGVIGSGEGAKPRDVLIKNADEFLSNLSAPENKTE